MARNNRCGCDNRRNNNGYGCLGCVGSRRWENWPIYNGPCPDADGNYCCCDDDVALRGQRPCQGSNCGIFSAMVPIAVAANGVIPMVCMNGVGGSGFPVNSGVISIAEGGTYLATYTVRVPEEAELKSTITLNVNGAPQSTAIAEVGGTAPLSSTAQAIFEVNDNATVTLRSTEAINITDTSMQPLFTLSLVRLD